LSNIQHKSISGYITFSPENSLEAQYACQQDLSAGLARLTSLVNESHITQDERAYLLDTIIHVCHHIACETREMKNDMKDKGN
jgi:hypothetical protein